MDKPLSFIVDPLTRAGAMGEHSPVDALVPSIVTEYAIAKGVSDDSYVLSPEAVSDESPISDGWRRLEWIIDDQTEKQFEGAEERAKAIIADSDDNVFHFNTYGADWIKAQGESRHPFSRSHSMKYGPDKIPAFAIHSSAFTRRVYSDGPSTSVVPNKRGFYRDIRNCAHTIISPWTNGDHPNANK